MDEIRELQRKIKLARKDMGRIVQNRARLAGVLAGAPGVVNQVVEFPDVDQAHVYQCTPSGYKIGKPTAYRLSFGNPLKWVGISHPWGDGFKPADIIVRDE